MNPLDELGQTPRVPRRAVINEADIKLNGLENSLYFHMHRSGIPLDTQWREVRRTTIGIGGGAREFEELLFPALSPSDR